MYNFDSGSGGTLEVLFVLKSMFLVDIVDEVLMRDNRLVLISEVSLEKIIMQEKMKKDGLGPRRKWLNDVVKKMEINLENTLKLAGDREKWRKAVHDTNSCRYRHYG